MEEALNFRKLLPPVSAIVGGDFGICALQLCAEHSASSHLNIVLGDSNIRTRRPDRARAAFVVDGDNRGLAGQSDAEFTRQKDG